MSFGAINEGDLRYEQVDMRCGLNIIIVCCVLHMGERRNISDLICAIASFSLLCRQSEQINELTVFCKQTHVYRNSVSGPGIFELFDVRSCKRRVINEATCARVWVLIAREELPNQRKK